ncbi:MAG TPA: phosphoribosyltransferase family protein, partial [Chitinophagaceae bacterium]
MFLDRSDAGRRLATRLSHYRRKNAVVLAVPRGGVPVGYEVSSKLELPLEIVLTRKIGHPANPEYAIGAAGLEDVFIRPHAGVKQDYIDKVVSETRERLRSMHEKFNAGHQPVSLKGKTVIIVDDGIATGNTMEVTVKIIRQQMPASVIIAVPVASGEAVRRLKKEADEVIVLLIPIEFYGVGAFYEDFSQVTDGEVILCLQRSRGELKNREHLITP